MILQEADILRIAKEPMDTWIEVAREDHKLLKAHYYGEGKNDLLKRIEQLENEGEFDLRKRYSLSNEFVTDSLLRPFDNIFSAKGGSVDIDIKVDSTKQLFKDQLKDVKAGLSDKEYLKEVWKDKLIADPAGLLFVEVKRDGSKSYITQKSITNIRKMLLHGIVPEYVMFEADVTINDEKEKDGRTINDGFTLHWLVDDVKYYRVKVWMDSDKTPEIIKQDTIINNFGRVPGITNSPIKDTNRNIPVSPIWKQVGLLTKYLVNGSVKEVYIAKHGYPIFWMYSNLQQVCPTCNGAGSFKDRSDPQERRICQNCGGGGHTYKKDVSDALLLKPPTSKDHPVLSAVAGYVQPDIDTWQEQRAEQDWTWNLIYFSLWGTTIERGTNETATGRFIDVQPVNNRLNDFADITEKVWKNIIDLFAKVYVKNSYNGVSVNIGRRFILETPDQIWKKYKEAKKAGASETLLDQLLEQYYEAEYQTNDMLREYYMKIMQVDPLPHNTLAEVSGLPVPQKQKDRKVFLKEWLTTKMMTEIIDLPIDGLIEDLDNFITENNQENGKTNDVPEIEV